MSLLNTDHGRSDVPNLLRCLQNEDVVELLYTQSDHILVLKTPQQVRDIAATMIGIQKGHLQQGYSLITAENCDWERSENDWEYTWSWFFQLPAFFERAANAGRYVVFSATQ